MLLKKKRVEKLTLQFLNQHSYFSQSQKRVVLDIIVSGKGVIPSEKINFIDSLNLKPENGIYFFLKDEFFSTLNRRAVDDEEYAN